MMTVSGPQGRTGSSLAGRAPTNAPYLPEPDLQPIRCRRPRTGKRARRLMISSAPCPGNPAGGIARTAQALVVQARIKLAVNARSA